MTQTVVLGNDFLFNQRHDNLRNRLSFELNQEELFRRIDAVSDLSGAGVLYTDGVSLVKLRPFKALCYINPVYIILKEAPPIQQKAVLQSKLQSHSTNSQLVGELAGAGLSCGAAILSWIVVFGAGSTIPASGGMSAAVLPLTIAAATASSTQCANSLLRSGFEVADPATNDWLDSQEWYTNTTTALDIISVAGAVASGFATIKLVITSRSATSRSFTEILKGLHRTERKRLTEEII